MSSEIINSFNTINEVEKYRKSINEECDNRIEFINLVKKADELSNKSFGYIKECFEAISPELFKTSEGKSVLNKYMSMVKGRKNLSTMHTICEGIRRTGKESDVNFFINKLSEKELGIDNSTLKEDVKSLGMILAEGYLLLGKEVNDMLPTENKILYSAIDYITENRCTLSNMSEYSDAVKVIRENIEGKDNVQNMFESKNLEDLSNELLNEFNKKYSDSLSEEETKILKEIASSDNREEIFNKYKSLCEESLNRAKNDFDSKGDSNSSKRISSVLEQVGNKKYALESIGEDVCNLIELSKIFD